jgi:uncharacterized membrane protein YphA (DoxX/SURF4 family)
MNNLLWILQVILALIFLAVGYVMAFPTPSQAKQMPYILAIPTPFRQILAVVDVLGGLGLVLPPLTHILPWLTPLAAICLVILMASAVVFHSRRREYLNVVFNLILLVLSAVVAYGRLVLVPF